MTESKLRQALKDALAVLNETEVPKGSYRAERLEMAKQSVRAALEEPVEEAPWTDCVETMKALFERHGETYKRHPEFNNRFTETIGRAGYMRDSFEDQGLGPVGSGGGDTVKLRAVGPSQDGIAMQGDTEPPSAPATEPTCKNPDCEDGWVYEAGSKGREFVGEGSPCPYCNEAPSGAEGEAASYAGHSSAVSGASPFASDLMTVTRADLHRLQYLSHAASDSVVTVDDDEMWDRIDRILDKGGAAPSALDDAWEVTYCTVRESEDCWDIECRFTDGQKFAAVEVDRDYEWLADKICAFLNGQATQGWQPIETAPKDGEWFLAAWDGKTRYAKWLDNSAPEHGRWQRFVVPSNQPRPHSAEPTHWMPLPAPPNGESE